MKTSVKTISKKLQYSLQKGITELSVAGYKSIGRLQTIDLKPLTILSGSNSSGKSSIMQPLLLLKQTLEAGYDPGPLLLNGPNLKYNSASDILTQCKNNKLNSFSVGIRVAKNELLTTSYKKQINKGFKIDEMTYGDKNEIHFNQSMSASDTERIVPNEFKDLYKVLPKKYRPEIEWHITRNRCFLEAVPKSKDGSQMGPNVSPSSIVANAIRNIIHLPGLRGNPARTYPITAVGRSFPGTFETYSASILADWQDSKNNKLRELCADLERLGLTWKVAASRINDTQVELKVGRLPHATRGGAMDLVNIADVGFGVSQTLPVVVALHVAAPGQTVYLEQPEIHLHPRAQAVMAEVITDAVNRGVKVVVETHSSIFLLTMQSLVAEEKLPSDVVSLHWFSRDDDGLTIVTSASLDSSGSFGQWPEDFGAVNLEIESRYLDAFESKLGVDSSGCK
ncbi:hypothetical protein RW64_10035 [Geobacter sulfurreducens]|nr:hypothetical protein RW64_10035 [Geobacter sulfurreducens]